MKRLIILENSKTSFGALHKELEEKGFMAFRVYNEADELIKHSFQKKEDKCLVVIDSLVADLNLQNMQKLKEKFSEDYLFFVHNSDDANRQKMVDSVGVNKSVIKSPTTVNQIQEAFENMPG